MIDIQLLTAEDWPLLKVIRLRALQDTPMAFGSTYSREFQLSDAEWLERARRWTDARAACYLALENGDACGIAAGFLDKEDATQAHLVSMWTAPTHRSRGIGRRLVAAVTDWAGSQNADTLRLMAVSSNAPAIGFYERLGFTPTGETEPYEHDPALVEIAMSRPVSLSTMLHEQTGLGRRAEKMPDLDADIVPSLAAAGIVLDQPIADVISRATPHAVEQRIGCRVLDYGAVRVFDIGGVVNQVCVFPGYRGKLLGKIAIGSSVSEVEAVCGVVVENEVDDLEVSGMPGWSFDAEVGSTSFGEKGWGEARIYHICIFNDT